MRLLQCFEQDYTKQISWAIDYIKKHIPTDALSLALALLTLRLVFPKDDETVAILQSKLLSIQSETGTWEAANFIKPKVHEPYKSETLTTAYALKALCL